MENFIADNPYVCQIRAGILASAGAKSFTFNEEEKNCAVYSSDQRQCDTVFGPPAPVYDPVACQHELPDPER